MKAMAIANLKLTAGVAAAVVITGTVGVVSYDKLIAAPPPTPGPAPQRQLAAAAATTPASTAPAELGEIDPDMAAILARKLPELRMEAIAAGDVIDFLRDVTGANIYVNTRALQAVGGDPNAPITMSVRDVAFADVLRQLVIPQMSNARGTFIATGGVIIITSADDVPRLRAAQEWHANMPLDAEMKTSLDRRLPEVNFAQIPVGDTIDFLRDITAANIFVNWRTLEVAGVTRKQPVTLRLRDVTLRTVLWLLLESAQAKPDAPLDFRVDKGIITISTPPDIALSEKRAPGPGTQKSPASAPRR
jgi:hypothetical protein